MKKTPPEVGDTVQVNMHELSLDDRPMFWTGVVKAIEPNDVFIVQDVTDGCEVPVDLFDIATDDPPPDFNP